MTGIVRANTQTAQRIGNDSVYGTGVDGSVIIAASYVSLSEDMYYENLTINENCTLNTNGYKIFVKNNLIVNGKIEYTNSSGSGTLSGSAALLSGNLSNSIGGSSASGGPTVSSLTEWQKKDLQSIIDGIVVDNSGQFLPIRGGASGISGSPGTVTPAGSGGAGTLNRNALAPGGPGTAGTTPPAASGGSAGRGGGIVLIAAKNILGTGLISSVGANATAGGPSATGSSGSSAPSQTLHHHVDGSAPYITGDGTHGTPTTATAPNLPHGGHLGARTDALYGHTWRHVHRGHDHGQHHNHNQPFQNAGHYTHSFNFANHGGGDYGHTWNTHGPYSPDNANYFHINGIPHSYPHRPHAYVAYTHDGAHHGNGNVAHGGGTQNAHFGSYSDNPVGTYFHHGASHDSKFGHAPAAHGGYHYPRNHQDINYTHTRHRAAGSQSHSGSRVYPGGSGGSAGSTTAGQNGLSGGGGGIIIVSDNIAQSINFDTSGGSVGGATAQSGLLLTIYNL
jgi:hypothetical protein